LHLLHELIDAEARRSLTRRIFLECRQKRAHDRLRRDEYARSVGHQPVVVGIRRDIRALIRVRPQIEEFRRSQLRKRLGPDSQRAGRTLFLKDNLPVLVTQRDLIAIVVEIDELLPSPTLLLARQVGKLVVAVEVDFKGLAPGLMAPEQLVLRHTWSRKARRL
jgi:hypothetical protein